MKLPELIYQKIADLSDNDQHKILEIINHISDKNFEQEDRDWNQFSLEQAVKGLENDNLPEYTEDDLIEKWQ